MYVNANVRTPTKAEHVVIAQSTVDPDGFYVVPAMIAIDGLTMTPLLQIWLRRPSVSTAATF
jgi:hypothetical protein